jgi:hypothetical protein
MRTSGTLGGRNLSLGKKKIVIKRHTSIALNNQSIDCITPNL